MSRYSKPGLDKVIATLEEWIEGSQAALDNAEGADYPNEERIDSLTERVDALQAALDSLTEIN